jgi:hypothetical protein
MNRTAAITRARKLILARSQQARNRPEVIYEDGCVILKAGDRELVIRYGVPKEPEAVEGSE